MADSTTKTAAVKKDEEKFSFKTWWKGIRSEFKKISWPSRETVVKETGAVIVISVILGLVISLIDTVLQYLLNFIM